MAQRRNSAGSIAANGKEKGYPLEQHFLHATTNSGPPLVLFSDHQPLTRSGLISHVRPQHQSASDQIRVHGDQSTTTNPTQSYPRGPAQWLNASPVPPTSSGASDQPPFTVMHTNSHFQMGISSDRAIREREDETRRARERDEEARQQVMKHFEESLRYVHQKKTQVRVGYPPSPQNDRFPGGPRATPPHPKGNQRIGYTTRDSPQAQGEDKVTRPDFVPELSNQPNQYSAPISSGDSIKEGHVENSNLNFIPFLSATPNRVKVSSPAPQQFYGKPTIPTPNHLPVRGFELESTPLSLTSKPISTSPIVPNMLSSQDEPVGNINYLTYASECLNPLSTSSDKLEYQTEPLNLGGRRREPEAHPVRLERHDGAQFTKDDRKADRDENEVLNLVKGKPNSVTDTVQMWHAENGNATILAKNVLSSEIHEAVELPKPPAPSEDTVVMTTAESVVPRARVTNATTPPTTSSIHKGKKVFLERHSGQHRSKFNNGVLHTAGRTSIHITEAICNTIISVKGRMETPSNGVEPNKKRPTTSACSDSENDSKTPKKPLRSKCQRSGVLPRKVRDPKI